MAGQHSLFVPLKKHSFERVTGFGMLSSVIYNVMHYFRNKMFGTHSRTLWQGEKPREVTTILSKAFVFV